MNRVLLAIGGLLVGLLALLFAAPTLVDWNRYRGVFEEEASRFLGREVRVGGRVNLRLLPVPYVQFENVRVADTTANVGRPLFTADDFTVWLSVGSLLAGRIEASELELRRPVVTLVLDRAGSGSWSSLAPTKLDGNTMAMRVTLDQVKITDGALAILGPDGMEKASFEHVNGELAAEDLDGPYRLTAAFTSGGAPREIRISTAKAADDGSVRFKGSVRDPASGVSTSLDGLASNVLKKLEISGDLSARLPLPGAAQAQATQAAGNDSAVGIDLKAQLKGDTSGFTLSDLNLTFEQGGPPQLATGSAKVDWTGTTDVTLALRSRWLDLDRITGAGKGGTPLELAQDAIAAVSRVLASSGRTEATLAIEQATLGGEGVSNLEAKLEHSKGQLEIRTLSAALPGGARLNASGTFTDAQPERRYAGRLALRGASLARFAGWIAKGRGVPLPARDGAFAASGDVTIAAREVTAKGLTIEVGRNVLTGEMSWRQGSPQAIVIALDGSEIDLTPVIGQTGDPAEAVKGLIQTLAGATSQSGAAGATDAEIKLRVDRLIAGQATFRDAAAELKLVGGNLSVPQLRLAASDGYSLDIKGDIAGLAKSAKGELYGLATADSPAGLVALAALTGLPAELTPAADDARLATPLRVAGRLQIGIRGETTRDLSLDGTAADMRVAGSVRLGAQNGRWQDRQSDLALSLEGQDAARIVGRLAGGKMPAEGYRASTTAGAAASLSVRVIGTPARGLSSLIAFAADGQSAEYRGRITIGDGAAVALDGDIDLSVVHLGRALLLVGLEPRPGFGSSMAGRVHLERAGGTTKLTPAGLRIAGAETSGSLDIDHANDKLKIGGELKVSAAGLQGLLGVFAAQGTALPLESSESPWSEAPLDLGIAAQLAGSRVTLKADEFALLPGVNVSEAKIELAARDGAIDAKLVEAKALGGTAKGQLSLDGAPTGIRLQIEGTLAGGRLERITATTNGAAAIAGGVAGTLKLQSAAQSARGLAVALGGSGEVVLNTARLPRWSPAAIGNAAEAVLGAKGEIQPNALRQQLEAALNAEGVVLGSPKLAITVADGALKLAPLTAALAKGRITGRASIDVDHQRFDGEWRIEPLNSAQPAQLPVKPELPGITALYSGPVSAIGSLAPRLDIEALEREVTVRKVEREVAELERLRRLDEERAREEAARSASEKKDLDKRGVQQQRLDATPLHGSAPEGARPPEAFQINGPTMGTGGPAAGAGAATQGALPTATAGAGTAAQGTAAATAGAATAPVASPEKPATQRPAVPATATQRRPQFDPLRRDGP